MSTLIPPSGVVVCVMDMAYDVDVDSCDSSGFESALASVVAADVVVVVLGLVACQEIGSVSGSQSS